MGKIREIFSNLKQGLKTPARDAAPLRVVTPPPYTAYNGLFSVASPPLSIATVYRCVKLLSDSVAQLHISYERLKDDIFVPDYSQPYNYLLNVQPDYCQSAFSFWSQAIVDVLLRGNAYIIPVYGPTEGGVEATRLVLTRSVSHDTTNDLYTVSDMAQGLNGTFSEDEVIHLKWLTHNDPKNGVSVLTHARLALNTASAGDAETQKRFATGGIVRGIVSNDKSVRGFGEYQDKELAKTAGNLDERFNVNGENIVALPGMVTYNGLSMTSADMQFLESRKFTVREICRFFGVHPSFVFDDTSNNYKSAEMAQVAFLSNTLNPILRNIENELQRKLVPQSLAFKRRFVFDRTGLMACDLDSRIRYQANTIAAGIYTVNEWRRIENKPEVEGGDRVLVSANLKGIEELTAQTGEPNKDKGDE